MATAVCLVLAVICLFGMFSCAFAAQGGANPEVEEAMAWGFLGGAAMSIVAAFVLL